MGRYYFCDMTEEFVAEILSIYNYYVINTTATFHARPLTLDEMREIVLFQNKKYRSFIICKDDEICGYVLITQHKKREAYDGTAEVAVYLNPAHVGKGIGSMAIKHIEEFAKQQGLHVLIATICGQNEGSIRLFEKNGYFQCAHYKEVGEKFGEMLDVVAYQKIVS